MKAVRIIALSIVGLVAAFVLHVPAFKLFSSLTTSSELRSFPPLSQGLQSDRYEVVRLIHGSSEIWSDQQTGGYLIVADLADNGEAGHYGRFVITVGQDGRIVDRRPVTSDAPLPDLEGAPRYTRLASTPSERQYVPNYRFGPLKGRLDMIKYQFTEFEDWPYFYYFFPVIPFDWKGIGYFKLSHHGDTFLFQQPTDFYGGPLYLMSNHDGQMYLFGDENAASGVAFLDVSESSYTRSMNGRETHRAAYGLHVIRPRRD